MRCPLLTGVVMLLGVGVVMAQGNDVRNQLLSTGKLRVGLNTGNLLTRAVGADIGRNLARTLGTEAVLVEYPSPAAVADAVGKEWDIAFIADDPARRAAIAFTPAYVQLDATYLVLSDSAIRAVADADRAGVKIATGAGAAYTLFMQRDIKRAELVFMGNDPALQALQAGTVHAVAGLRDTLQRLAARTPGSRVLPDNVTRAQQAVALPKANTAAVAYVTAYLAELKSTGFIAAAVQKTGAAGASVVQ